VWRTDAEGRFSQISPEFALSVGEAAADVVGRRFRDVAEALGLDPTGEIAGLLARRDTWSGRSVLWPVAGTRLRIPVDLAALPVYDRNRNFEGFRGFGVARGGDAVVDPRAPDAPVPARGTAAGETRGQRPAEPPAEPDRPLPGEAPARETAPQRRASDTVIRLAQHRQPANDKGLSSGERLAFQQIAERLRKESGLAAGEPPAVQPSREVPPQGPAGEDREDSGGAHPQPAGGQEGGADAAESRGIGASLQPSGGDETGKATAAQPVSGTAATPRTADRPVAEPKPRRDGIKAAQRRPARPGLSLLDFARWDADRPHDPEGGGEAAAEIRPGAEIPAASAAAGPEPHRQTEAGHPGEEEAPGRGARELRPQADDGAGPGSPAATGGLDRAEAGPSHPGAPDAGAAAPGRGEAPIAAATAPVAATQPERRSDTSILEKLPIPVLVHSGDTLHYANAEFLALTGYASIGELAGAGGIGALFAEPYENGDAAEPSDRQLRLRNRDGEESPVKAFLRSAPWNGGKALLLVLTRSKESGPGTGQSPLVAELEAHVAEMRTIIDTATDGVVLISPDGTIRSISRPAEALFGFDSDEIAGRPFTSLFAMESQRAARDYLSGLSDHGVASVLNDGREVIGRESEGRFIPLFMTIGKLPADSGYCAVVRDITQWKRAEEDLTQARAVAERASAQKTDFLARISHEIRTPLNAIIGFSELMIDEKFGPVANDRYRDYLRDINRSGNHVLDLVNDLLDISKIEAGQQEMAYEAVSLNDTLAETVAMMQPQANRERVIIRSSFASKLPEVVADLRSVRQIALNMLSNAVRYTQAGGQVIVSTSYEATGEVVMRVRDTGIGMTREEIEQALKPFKQISSLKRARGDGTGLGLPLTKAMVEANRAKFSISSTPGEGTLVEISFPSTRVLAA